MHAEKLQQVKELLGTLEKDLEDHSLSSSRMLCVIFLVDISDPR